MFQVVPIASCSVYIFSEVCIHEIQDSAKCCQHYVHLCTVIMKRSFSFFFKCRALLSCSPYFSQEKKEKSILRNPEALLNVPVLFFFVHAVTSCED